MNKNIVEIPPEKAQAIREAFQQEREGNITFEQRQQVVAEITSAALKGGE